MKLQFLINNKNKLKVGYTYTNDMPFIYLKVTLTWLSCIWIC